MKEFMSKAKFQQIYEDLRLKISQGIYQAGERLPTEKELARSYEVAVLTLRQALRMLREEGLLESRRYHGTIVTGRPIMEVNVAENLSSDPDQRKVIGVVVPGGIGALRHPVFSRLVDGVEGVVTENGYTMEFVYSNPENRQAEKELKRAIRESQALGWMIPTTVSLEVKAAIQKRGTPCVLFHAADDLFSPHLFLMDAIGLAHAIGAHLEEQGYRDIWVVAPEDAMMWRNTLQRVLGKEVAGGTMKARSAQTDDYSASSAEKVATRILNEQSVDVFVCGDDELAAGVMQAIAKAGRSSPEIGVIGGGDFPLGSMTRPSLSTVFYPYYQLGREGSQLLVDILAGRKVEPVQRLFVPKLLVRESSMRIQVSDTVSKD